MRTKEEIAVLFEKCRLYNKAAVKAINKPRGVCKYLGDPIRDAVGDGVKQACAPCGGKARQAFRCSHELTPNVITLGDCARCPYHKSK